ncbi:hypothetical protein V6N13_098280 [Hibiscus sabdariffa]|uniref:Uncharacterized protein n=1 Tax=Hibiscus sabdariffa TaxID=183260 RepID=A0ABR2EDB3_9ROSI
MRVASTSMGPAGKVILEGANKGFKVKKLMDSKVARPNIVEWVKSAHARIDHHNESGVEHDPYNEVMLDSGDQLMDRLGGDQ